MSEQSTDVAASGDAGNTDTVARVFEIILDRKANPREGSYTASLFAAGENEILKKLGEEAVEVIIAAKGETNDRVVYEMADLLYHSLVFLADRGMRWDDILDELAKRIR